MNLVDRVVSWFSPKKAFTNSIYRSKLELLSSSVRRYDASSNSNRLSLWNTANNSPNLQIKSSAQKIRARARDLVNNNPYAKRAVEVVSTNVVGTGVIPNIKSSSKRKEKIAKDYFKSWCVNSTKIDKEKTSNIYGIQKLYMSTITEDGECFIVREKKAKSIPGENNFVVKLLDADYLDHNKNEVLSSGGEIIQGIEYNSNNDRVAYHFYKKHPSEAVSQNDYVRIKEEDVIHGFDKTRVKQGRGVSKFHAVIIKLRELDIFEDASLKKQQIAALFSAFIYDSTGEGPTTTDGGSVELGEKLEVGRIDILPPGKDIKFANPPTNTDAQFIRQHLMAVATGIGITYEALTNDYSNVNFSSGRMGFLEFNRNIKNWQRDIIEIQMMTKFMDWFFEGLNLATPININLDPTLMDLTFTKPAREMIDPSKEVPANISAVEAGFKSRSKVIREGGENPDEVFEEIKEEKEQLGKLGLNFEAKKGESNGSTQGNGENTSIEDAD